MTTFNFSLASLNGTALTGLRSVSVDRREQQSAIGTDGGVHETSAAVIRAAPMARLRTISVRSLFALMAAATEIPFVALNGTTGLVMYGGKLNSAGPGWEAGSVHKTVSGPRGFAFLESLRWSPGQPAEAEFAVYFFAAAGATDPLTTGTAAMPATPINTEQLSVSDLTINGTSVPRVRSIDVQLSHRCDNAADECYQLGLPYPVQCTQAGVAGNTEIMCTIETMDLTAVYANGPVAITLTALNHLGVGLAATTATMTINGTIAREEGITGDHGGVAGRRLIIRGTFNGTTRPCTIATA